MKISRTITWILFFSLMCNGLTATVTGTGNASEKQDEKASPAGTEEKEDEKEPRGGVVRNFWQDEKRIWTSPFRASAKDLLVWGGVLAVSGVLIHNDERIYRDIKDFQAENEWADKATPFFSRMAQGYPFALAGAIWLTGALTKNAHSRETGSLALQAMLHSFIVVQVVKHLTGRARPSAFNGEDQWAGPEGFFKRYEEGKWSHYDAMFSGHTVTLWSLATVLAHQYRKSVVVPILAYSLATLGGMATITDDLHWISDVFLGAVVGYAIARFVIKRRSRRFQVMPVIHRGGVGVGVSFVF